jgi:hypothetical protein
MNSSREMLISVNEDLAEFLTFADVLCAETGSEFVSSVSIEAEEYVISSLFDGSYPERTFAQQYLDVRPR